MVKEEGTMDSQKDETKKWKKIMRDSGYDCNYFHRKNHLSKECMLRRLSENKNVEDKNEAYYLRKLRRSE